MKNTMRLFYPLKWDKTYAALGKTNSAFSPKNRGARPTTM